MIWQAGARPAIKTGSMHGLVSLIRFNLREFWADHRNKFTKFRMSIDALSSCELIDFKCLLWVDLSL
jgi:hypothetical protein